jgi:hypothetical protein
MATINRQELDRLERRELQLTIMAAVFVFVLASGLAVFMYPLVFVHPDAASKWTLRVAFFGFCALTLLFIGYLLERQSTVRKLKQQILEELAGSVPRNKTGVMFRIRLCGLRENTAGQIYAIDLTNQSLESIRLATGRSEP